MSGVDGPNRRRLLLALLGALGVVLLAVLPFALRDAVARAIVEPAARFVWAARQIFRMVPQTDLWTGLVLLAALNMALIFARRARLPGPTRPPVSERGRIAAWRDQLAVGRQARRLLVRPLLNLVVQTIARTREESEVRVREDLYAGRIALPPDVQRLLAEQPARSRRRPASANAATATGDPRNDLFADLAPDAAPPPPEAPRADAPAGPLPPVVLQTIDYMEQLLGEPER